VRLDPKGGARSGVERCEEAMMKTTIVAALALGVGIMAATPAARAEGTSKGDYTYNFDDDKLLGKDVVGNTPQIRVRATGKRDLLHRPRLQFVQEMLKSVENM
jgi:hypothetical protein